jgi:hypothetical protein
MAVTQTVILIKAGGAFSSLADAVVQFETDVAGNDLTASKEHLENAITNGTCVQTGELNDSGTGYVITRSWADETWADRQLLTFPDMDKLREASGQNGWTKTVKIE